MKQSLSQSLKHRDIWVILALFIIVTMLAVLSQKYINTSATLVAENFPAIAAAIEQENWQEARALFETSRQHWQRVVKSWPLLINHNDMWDVEISFVDMQVLLEQENGPDAAKEIANLRFYLRHVPQNERFSWQNIL